MAVPIYHTFLNIVNKEAKALIDTYINRVSDYTDLLKEELLNEIFNKENRPTILKKNIRRVIPSVNLQI